MTKSIFYLLAIFALLLTGCTGYEVKDDGVYYKSWNEGNGSSSMLMEDADANTFETLSDHIYGKDKNAVFYRGQKIPGADPNTFKLLEELYAVDKSRAYYAGDSIATSGSEGFEIIDAYYSKDRKNVYYETNPLNVCSVGNFRFVYTDKSEDSWERWTTDGCHYFMKNYKIPSDEYGNIKLFKGSAGIATDSRYVYFLDRNMYYDEDGKRVLDTIDLATFQVSNYIDCKDKYGCINVFHGREDCR